MCVLRGPLNICQKKDEATHSFFSFTKSSERTNELLRTVEPGHYFVRTERERHFEPLASSFNTKMIITPVVAISAYSAPGDVAEINRIKDVVFFFVLFLN